MESKISIGILGYLNEEAIAWCSVAPRETYRSLGGDENLESVWSIVCFFVKKRISRKRSGDNYYRECKRL